MDIERIKEAADACGLSYYSTYEAQFDGLDDSETVWFHGGGYSLEDSHPALLPYLASLLVTQVRERSEGNWPLKWAYLEDLVETSSDSPVVCATDEDRIEAAMRRIER